MTAFDVNICCGQRLQWRYFAGIAVRILVAKCGVCKTSYHMQQESQARHKFIGYGDGYVCDKCGCTTKHAAIEYPVTKDDGTPTTKNHIEINPYCPNCEEDHSGAGEPITESMVKKQMELIQNHNPKE